ncbi:unnamed protein product [Cuscuta campestris]|uniref:Bromo domain-containing protein n=1 Tax=Cuscuta campestris TaxID=132261 RepID=A0A484KZN3_9ASTE|nr:unnamed protein product [Cuscuta campestris]
MADVALRGRDELNWTPICDFVGKFMGKASHSRAHLNPNANSNPKKKQKHLQRPVNGSTHNDDAYSFNQPPKGSNGVRLGGSYLTYNIQSYTKSELVEVRMRLMAELEQVRNLRDRIESGQFSTCTTNPRTQGKSQKFSGNRELSNGYSDMNVGVIRGGIGVVEMENMMKTCRQILAKLMKHKHCWVFSSPVDAEGLGLPDYRQIIKRPMDLGTVKSNLQKNLYPTPVEFAADVRLTFNNALLYNPKTDDVHGWGDLLLTRFEELFRPIEDKLSKFEPERRVFPGNDELHSSFLNHISVPEISKKPYATPIPQVFKKQEISQSQTSASTHSVPPPHVHQESHGMPVPESGSMGKQPKPRAKDLNNKREMTMDEKHKLGFGLQNLPEERMPQLLQIIRKRNEHMAQDGDEIELDIEALDTETLWELDRFVTNCKKAESKTKRQALGDYNSTQNTSNAETDQANLVGKLDSVENPRVVEFGEEDIDIGDDIPASSFAPVEIEKEDVVAVREHDNQSSSSSSDSSSSSGSDSGSSSSSDSDPDDAQS